MFAGRHWIPPAGVLFGQLCHGASWLLALGIALRLNADPTTLPAIAWIHLVALGWVTVTALSILLHAIPALLDVTWKHESFARFSLGVAAAGIAAFVIAICVAVPALGIVATAVALALLAYLTTAWQTLAEAFGSNDRIERAVARAFAVALAMLGLAILLGLTLAWALSGAVFAPWIVRLPGVHANVALFGWLTLLIYGVSARTLRSITGNRSRWPKMHVIVGSATLLGAVILPAGIAAQNNAVCWIGGALLALGAACYIVDAGDVVRRATVTHRPPQAFVIAALAWLALAIALGAGAMLGKPWQAAYVFVLLVGWVAQMVDAHLFHFVGAELLDARAAWLAFALFQIAVAAITVGLLLSSKNACAFGALAGFFGWVVTLSAMNGMRRFARSG
jgi:hypothetical protein